MPTRDIDPEFGVTEQLWRRIERGQVRQDKGKTACKGGAFRLQVSLVRAKHGSQSTVCVGKWNGIAESTAQEVTSIRIDDAEVVCVDEPTDDEPGHCLAAIVLPPGKALAQDVKAAARERFAKAFRVILAPS